MSTVIKLHKGVQGSSGVQQSYGLWYEIVPESGGARTDAAVASTRWQQLEQFVAGVMWVFYNPVGLLPAPLSEKVLHGWQQHPGNVLGSFHHPL